MRSEKQLLLDDFRERIENSHGFILTRYQNMDANLASEFRAFLYHRDADFEVVRKLVFLKSLEDFSSIDTSLLDGHLAVIFARNDLLAVAKDLFQFREKHEELLEVVLARSEGKVYSAKQVEWFSKLPSKQGMRAEFLGVLEAVALQNVMVMEALLRAICFCLEQQSTK